MQHELQLCLKRSQLKKLSAEEKYFFNTDHQWLTATFRSTSCSTKCLLNTDFNPLSGLKPVSSALHAAQSASWILTSIHRVDQSRFKKHFMQHKMPLETDFNPPKWIKARFKKHFMQSMKPSLNGSSRCQMIDGYWCHRQTINAANWAQRDFPFIKWKFSLRTTTQQ